MTEVYPISCVSCRRRKIKCNKLKPCNQCERRSIKCQYPESFRNIKISEKLIEKTNAPSQKESDDLAIKTGVLVQEKNFLSQVNENLMEQNEKLNLTVQKLQENQGNHDEDEGLHISGETSENGDKFYGPTSANFMISSLKNSSDDVDFDTEDGDHLKREDLIKNSLIKKKLPALLPFLDEHENLILIKRMVAFFFSRYYYSSFISSKRCQDFLEDYENQNFENVWENDDDLLLLYMILITATRKLSKNQLTMFNLDTKLQKKLMKHLHKKYEKLRHNLINESIVTVISYVLAVEHHFYNQKYEESWSMMFHCTSIAYAIGLHVCGKNIDPNGDADLNERLSIWFSVKLTAGMLCSALGRPNPISLEISNLGSFEKISWKIGLSECIRLSNMMLIDSYMMNIELSNLLQLEAKFNNETQLIENYYQQQILNQQQNTTGNNDNLEICKELLTDIILFYSNRAKLWQPFTKQYPEANNIITASVISVLNFSIQLLNICENKHIRRVYPFVYSSIYQCLVVFFTYLHFNFKELNKPLVISIQSKIKQLYESDLNWQVNMKTIIYKINEVIAKFVGMHQNRNPPFSNQNYKSNDIGFIPQQYLGESHMIPNQVNIPAGVNHVDVRGQDILSNFEIDPTLGFELADPFFIQHPENIPYYSSPSSIDEQLNLQANSSEIQNNNSGYNYYANPFNTTSS